MSAGDTSERRVLPDFYAAIGETQHFTGAYLGAFAAMYADGVVYANGTGFFIKTVYYWHETNIPGVEGYAQL